MAPKDVDPLALTEVKSSDHTDQQEYLLDFYGIVDLNVTVTHNEESIRRWISDARQNSRRFLNNKKRSLVVGLSFGGELDDSISTIHVSVARKCLIIQLHRLLESRKSQVPAILTDFFSQKHIMFVGIGPPNARILRNFGIETRQIYDLKAFLGEENEKASYKEILEIAKMDFPFDLDPNVTNSRWTKTKLAHNQISQAAAESFVNLKTGIKLLNEGTRSMMKVQEIEDPCEALEELF